MAPEQSRFYVFECEPSRGHTPAYVIDRLYNHKVIATYGGAPDIHGPVRPGDPVEHAKIHADALNIWDDAQA